MGGQTVTWRDSGVSAFRGLARHRLRAGLTLVGLVAGIATIIVLVAIGQGVAQVVTSRIETLGTNELVIAPAPGVPFPLSQATLVAPAFPFPVRVVPEIIDDAVLRTQTTQELTAVIGTTPEYDTLAGMSLVAGQFLTGEDMAQSQAVAVLSVPEAQTLFGQTPALGSFVMVRGQALKVIGVLDSPSSEPGAGEDHAVWVPISEVRTLFGLSPVTQLVVQTANDTQALLASRYLSNRYAQEFRTSHAVAVTANDQIVGTLRTVRRTFTHLVVGSAMMALIAAGLGIMNMMLVSVTERTAEIGLRRAMGASREDILLQFLLESMGLSFVGGLAGILVSLGMVAALPALLAIPAIWSGRTIVMAFVFSEAVGLFFGLYPAVKASRLVPIEALRVKE